MLLFSFLVSLTSLFIQALVTARKELNLTQKELSERTGITQADISRIENGTGNPGLEMLKLPFFFQYAGIG